MKNSSLKTLLLRSNFIGDAGAISIAHGISSSKATLEKLDLSSNEITDRGGKEIIKSLNENNSLLHISLRANYLEDVGATFVKLTKERNNLITVDLNLNSIRQKYIEEINENLKKNRVVYGIKTKLKLRQDHKSLLKEFSVDMHPNLLKEIEDAKQHCSYLKTETEEIKESSK